MNTDSIFTIYLKNYDPEAPDAQRIREIRVGNSEIRVTKAVLDFETNDMETLILHIPLRYVNIEVEEED